MKYAQFIFWPVFAGVAAAALLTGGRHPYQMLYIFAGVTLFSLVFAAGAFFSVRVMARLPRQYVVTGQALRWRVAARNSFFLPIPVLELVFLPHGHMDGPASVTLHVGARRKAETGAEHTFTCRGTYTVGIARWRAYDYLALFRAGRRLTRPAVREACQARIDVLPRVLRFDGAGFNRPYVECRAFTPTAQPEFDGVRPYENTDTLRSIHWKLSAKADGDAWMVKKTRGSVPMPTAVLIDMTALPAPDGGDKGDNTDGLSRAQREDKLLETAFSLIYHLLGAGPVQAAVLGRAVERYELRSRYEFMDFYRQIGVRPFEEPGGAAVGAREYAEAMGEISDDSALWVVSWRADGAPLDIVSRHIGGDNARGYWLYIPGGGAAAYKEQAALESVSAMGVPAAAIERDIRDALWVFSE